MEHCKCLSALFSARKKNNILQNAFSFTVTCNIVTSNAVVGTSVESNMPEIY